MQRQRDNTHKIVQQKKNVSFEWQNNEENGVKEESRNDEND